MGRKYKIKFLPLFLLILFFFFLFLLVFEGINGILELSIIPFLGALIFITLATSVLIKINPIVTSDEGLKGPDIIGKLHFIPWNQINKQKTVGFSIYKFYLLSDNKVTLWIPDFVEDRETLINILNSKVLKHNT